MNTRRPTVLMALLVLAAAAVLLPVVLHPTWFPFSPGAEFSDILVAHLPAAEFLHRALGEWRQIPLWNPTLLSGMPVAGDPLSGVWYPPFWLLVAMPSALMANVFFVFHLVLAGMGMVLLLRSEGTGEAAALTAGIAFAGLPKLVGHIGLGHMSLVAAVAWTPWVLWAGARAVDGLEAPGWFRRFVGAGVLLGAVFLADPRWIVPSAVLLGGYLLWRVFLGEARVHPRGRVWRGAAGLVVAAIGIGAGLAIPLAELVSLSTRGSLATASVETYALPAARLLGLLVANPGGWAEWMTFVGSVVVVLCGAGLLSSWRRSGFWMLAAFLSILLALGDATPIGSLAGSVPGFGLLRVPARWLFVTGMALAALAGHGVAAASSGDDRIRRRARLGSFAVGGMVVASNAGMAVLTGVRPAALLSSLVAVLAVAAVFLAGRTTTRRWGEWALPLLVLVELMVFDPTLIVPRSPDSVQAEGRRLAGSLALSPGARLFSPSYSLGQDVAAGSGLELADGVHPLQLASYVEFMAKATGMDATGYSVTLPPFPSGDPSQDWGPVLDARRLGLLSVETVLSAYPIRAEGLLAEKPRDGVYVYHNEASRPRAWVEARDGSGTFTPVEELAWTPNHIRLRASGPGLLVLSDPVYPGWRASLDGATTTIEPYSGILRSMDLPPGDHDVVFSYVPVSLGLGLALAFFCWLIIAMMWRKA